MKENDHKIEKGGCSLLLKSDLAEYCMCVLVIVLFLYPGRQVGSVLVHIWKNKKNPINS